jgi:predicted nucleic acid-binding protein
MATYVVDASILIEYLVTGPYTENARALFRQSAALHDFIIPEFCLLECANVLWKHVRFQGMSASQAEALLRHLGRMPLTRVPVKSALRNGLSIGLRRGLAVYDSIYIALAQRSLYPLITVDRPQERAAAAENVALKPLTDFRP